MPKQITKYCFFFFIFFLFFLIPINSFSPFVVGETNEPFISTDILSVQLGSFQDNTPNDGSGKLNYIQGGFDLISFENLGVYSVNEETNTIIYRAEAVWGYEINVWTSALFKNIYPFIKTDKVVETSFLTIQYWTHIFFVSKQVSHPSWSLSFYDIDYGTTEEISSISGDIYNFSPIEVDVPGSYLQHDYHGSIPVSVGIQSGLAYGGQIKIAGNSFTVPELIGDVLYTKVANMRGGECGSYEDRYTKMDEGESSASVNIKVPEGTWSSETQKLTNWFNEQNVGKVSNIENVTLPIQQEVYDLSFKGMTLQASGTSNMFDFNLPIHIQPGVTKLVNNFNLKAGGFQWWQDWGDYKRDPWTVDKQIRRDVSVHVDNVFVHYDFELKTDLFMTCQFSAKLSETFLDDPNLVISDMVWDLRTWGDKDVDINLPREWDWWMWILIIILIGISLYVVYKVLKKRQERPQINVYTQR